MSGPPYDVAPADLWAQIVATPRPSRIVDYPKNGEDGRSVGQIRMVVLTQSEQMESASSAQRVAKKFMREEILSNERNLGYEAVFSNASAVEIVFRATRKVDSPGQFFFPSPDEMRKKLSIDEVGSLMGLYLTVQSELGPIVSYLSDLEVEAWIARLSEGGSRLPLALLTSEAQSELLMHLVSLVQSLRTEPSLPGLQRDEVTLEDLKEDSDAIES